jgi:hypothetical protein
MVLERTSVGLDVHARSIVAEVLDSATGQVWSLRLPPATEAVLRWVRSLPGPVGSPMRLARPGSGWPGRSRRPGWLCGGGVVQAGTPTRGSGQDRPARRRTAGPVAAHWGAARGAGADPGRGGSPGSGPSPRRRPRGSDAGPPPAVEAAAAPGAGLCRGGLDPGARPLAGQRGGGAGPAGPTGGL